MQLLKQRSEREAQPPRPLSQVPIASARADQLPVLLRGSYDTSHTYLLDNRFLGRQVGFEVLVPFHEAQSGRYVLVNRGFVPMGPTREILPEIPPLSVKGESSKSETAVGNVYVAPAGDHIPTHATSALGSSATIVEVASPALMARLMGKPFYPHLIRLSKSDPNALPRYWPVTMMTPARHRAYAVQWFAMAVVLLGAWAVFSFKRQKPKETS